MVCSSVLVATLQNGHNFGGISSQKEDENEIVCVTLLTKQDRLLAIQSLERHRLRDLIEIFKSLKI